MPFAFLHLARARHHRDRRATAQHLRHRSLLPRCGDSRQPQACRRYCAPRSEITHCARCPTVFAAPAPHRTTGPSGPAPVCARLKHGAAQPDVARARARKFLRSLPPPGTRGTSAPAVALYHTTRYLAAPFFMTSYPERTSPCMAKKRGEPRKYAIPTSFEQARDELFSHIL